MSESKKAGRAVALLYGLIMFGLGYAAAHIDQMSGWQWAIGFAAAAFAAEIRVRYLQD